jgi:DNA-directed RNA polymerase specialized sigma24 family protein
MDARLQRAMTLRFPGGDVDVARLRRIASGDGEALAEVFDAHSPVLLGLLVRILGSRSEAEEALQEVFQQVWAQADDYDPVRSTPLGWMLAFARERAIQRLRHREQKTGSGGSTER